MKIILLLMMALSFAAHADPYSDEVAKRLGKVAVPPSIESQADDIAMSYGADHGLTDIKDKVVRDRMLNLAAIALRGNIISAQALAATYRSQSWYKSDTAIPKFDRFIREATDFDDEDAISISAAGIIEKAGAEASRGLAGSDRVLAYEIVRGAVYGDKAAMEAAGFILKKSNKPAAVKAMDLAVKAAAEVQGLGRDVSK